MLKLIALALFISIAITPGFASAEASRGAHSCKSGDSAHRHDKACKQHGTKARKTTRHRHEAKRSALDVVQHDPCLSEKYRRFTAKHKSERQRRRFAERLAREGCPQKRQAHYDGNPDRSGERHARYDHRYDVRRYADPRYDDDRYYAPRAEQSDDESGYEVRSPLLELFQR